MAAPNQSQISPNAFTFSTGAWQRTAVVIAAWFEILVGVSFLIATNAQSQFVFGATPEGAGVIFGQFSGIALIALGIACMPSRFVRTHQVAVRALFIFNIAVAIFFAWVGVATPFRGVMLWPVVIMHTVIAIALLLVLRREDS